MGIALFLFLLVLKAVFISQQDISSEDVKTMLDRLSNQSMQDNNTSISIEMNRETYLQQEVAESSNDSDIYYLKTLHPRPVSKTSGEILDNVAQLRNITSEKISRHENETNFEPVLENRIIPGVPGNFSVITEKELKENVKDDHNILGALLEDSEDEVINHGDDRSGMSLKTTTRKNIPELSTTENNPDQQIHELDLIQEYPETIVSRKSNNKEESVQILDQIFNELKDTIDIDNIIKAVTLGQKSTTTAMLLNGLNDANPQVTNNLVPLNYAPEALQAVLSSYDPRNDIFAGLLEDILHNKPKNDLIVNEVLSTFDNSLSRSSNMLLEKVLQQRVNTADPAYEIPYRQTSFAPTLIPRFTVPQYQPNFRRSIVNHPLSYTNQPLMYHSWRPINSQFKYSPGEKFKHTYFTSSLIDQLTTRHILKPLNYNSLYK